MNKAAVRLAHSGSQPGSKLIAQGSQLKFYICKIVF